MSEQNARSAKPLDMAAREASTLDICRQMSKVDASLAAMSSGLAERAFCSDIHLTLSDIAVGCALGYLDFRFAHVDWRTRHPDLAKLYEKLAQRASFADTLPS